MIKVTSFQERTISRMGKVIAILAFFICSYAWSACQPYNYNFGGVGKPNCEQGVMTDIHVTCEWFACPQQDGNACIYRGGGVSCPAYPYEWAGGAWVNCLWCETECEKKEVECSRDTSKVWNPDNCQCENKPPPSVPCSYCEDYVDYSTFPPVLKSKNYRCLQCLTDSMGATIAAGCTLERDSEGSCKDNDDCPEGMICNDSTPNVDCYATVGATVYLRDRKSGHVWGCDADGDCQNALRKYAMGQCQDPNPLPSSSSGGANSSSGGGANSSSSEEPTSSGSVGPWGLEKTLKENTAYAQKTAENTGDIANYTVTIMGKTSDIYNELIEHGITLNNIKDNTDDIKSNTGATATNTGNIDNKLTRTNNLLDSINKKNWNPHINVQPPEVTVNFQGDTNSVTVNVDTSRAPSEILNLLRNFFGSADTSSNYNPQDTAGAGDDETSMIDSIKSKVGSDTVPNMKDSIPNAVNGVKLKMRAFRDSVNNSAFGDSLTRWENQLLNNGVITGNGSDNCPSLFTRTFTWNMGQKLGTWNIGKFQFICEPIQGVGVSLWTLARTLLRAIVAISCMLWLYRTVLGVEGSNDED